MSEIKITKIEDSHYSVESDMDAQEVVIALYFALQDAMVETYGLEEEAINDIQKMNHEWCSGLIKYLSNSKKTKELLEKWYKDLAISGDNTKAKVRKEIKEWLKTIKE